MTARSPDIPVRATQERSTRQKRALAAVLDSSEAFRSAQDLFSDLRARGEDVGLTTVYNQLRSLVEAGEVDTLRSNDGETLYRRCGSEHHHHHLLCRHCGRTVEVEGPELERWADEVADAHSFTEVVHTFEIVGTCDSCTREQAGRA
jgi:Fur family transcriptional regulator, ferric uptake regulator